MDKKEGAFKQTGAALEIALFFTFAGQIISLFWTRAHVNWDITDLFFTGILNMDTFWFPKNSDATFYVQFIGNLRDFMLANILCWGIGIILFAIAAFTRKRLAFVLPFILYTVLFAIVAVPWFIALLGDSFCKAL